MRRHAHPPSPPTALPPGPRPPSFPRLGSRKAACGRTPRRGRCRPKRVLDKVAENEGFLAWWWNKISVKSRAGGLHLTTLPFSVESGSCDRPRQMPKRETSNPNNGPSYQAPRYRPNWVAAVVCFVLGAWLTVALVDYAPSQSS